MKPYYEHGGVAIYHGNCMEVLHSMERGAVGGCVTDPPYSSGGQYRSDRANSSASEKYSDRRDLPDFSGDNRDQRGFLRWCSIWMAEVLRVCEAGAPMFAFTDWRQLPTMTDAIQAGGWNWQGLFVWDKAAGRPQKNRPTQSIEFFVYGVSGQVRAGEKDSWVCLPPIIRAAVPTAGERWHVTEKPLEVIQYLLPLVRPETAILDPFMGSGTTLVAAKSAGRRAIGIEIEERYCEIAATRLAQESLGLPPPRPPAKAEQSALLLDPPEAA